MSINEDTSMTTEERSLPATKGDIIRLQNDIHEMAKSITELVRQVAVLESRPQHQQPCRDFTHLRSEFDTFRREHSPCRDLSEHLALHRELMADIRHQVMGILVKAVASLVGLYAAAWAIKEIKGL